MEQLLLDFKTSKVQKSVYGVQKVYAKKISEINVQKVSKIVQKKFATKNIKLFPDQEGL